MLPTSALLLRHYLLSTFGYDKEQWTSECLRAFRQDGSRQQPSRVEVNVAGAKLNQISMEGQLNIVASKHQVHAPKTGLGHA